MTDYPEAWEMKPRQLSFEEIESPEKVIHGFFGYAQLPQARAYLWESMKTLVTGNFGQLRSRDRSSLIFFFEQLGKLIEGAHVMYEKHVMDEKEVCRVNGAADS